MIQFGAGVLIGTQTIDATGAAVATPTPIQFGILQEVSIDEEFESKLLYGANQYPVAVGRGKGKISLKAKAALINAELFNTFVYGLTLGTAYENVVEDLTGNAIPTGGTVTPTSATANVVADLGARDGNGIPFTRVTGTPTGGEYHYAAGVWDFGDVDVGKTAFINYAYSSTGVAAAKSITVTNLPMGYSPFFQVDLRGSYQGKTVYTRYPNATSTKLSMTMKNDDFTIPEFDIECFADSNGNIAYKWFSE
jgi:hypothetical protein